VAYAAFDGEGEMFMAELGTEARPLRVAVVGSGPGGFYAADALFKSGKPVTVDMFERLPTPFGLVRGGVAPDHLKIKGVTRVFEKIADHEGFAFLGNVQVGRDIYVAELCSCYDAIVLATGAETDRRLGIPGEDLRGSHSATELVGWYNGHPDYRNHSFDLSQEVAVIVGQGNVALDVARILSKTAEELVHTDIAKYALEALAYSRIKEIYLVGRRGPVQAAFTPHEIKELGGLVQCDPVVDAAYLTLNLASQTELDDPDNYHSKKNLAVLSGFAARPASGKRKRCHIRFYLSPVEIGGAASVEYVLLERNELVGESFHQKAHGTGAYEKLACGLLFRSVGYRGVPMPGVPFDEVRGVCANREGRILDGGAVAPGLYATGWIKRGASGTIGTNKQDSAATVQALLADLPQLPPCPTPDTGAVGELLASRRIRVVSLSDWRRIDAAEVERGKRLGKPREKFTSIEEMLAILD
jgi:ferredoxin--NADP+ reductase